MNKAHSVLMTTALAALLSANTAASEQQPSFAVNAGAGYRYDSNVSLAELDTNTGEADNARLLAFAVDGTVPIGDWLAVKAAYGYVQTDYEDFSEFDTAIHRLQGDVTWRAGGIDTGLSLRHFAASLDRDRFLDIRQLSPSVARLFANRLYLRGAYTSSKKRYAEMNGRDAHNDAIDVDAYWLLNGMKRFVAFGYRIDSEDADAAAHDYDGNRVKLTYGHELKHVQVKVRLQLEQRDYVGVNETTNETAGSERLDDRLRASLSATLPFNDNLRVEGEAQYAEHRSNLASANFDEAMYSVNLAATF